MKMTTISPLEFVFETIEKANLKELEGIAAHLSTRLYELEKRHSGKQAACLEEAASFGADMVRDIGAAMRMNEVPCACGICDDCMAAASDAHHDRKRDLVLVKG